MPCFACFSLPGPNGQRAITIRDIFGVFFYSMQGINYSNSNRRARRTQNRPTAKPGSTLTKLARFYKNKYALICRFCCPFLLLIIGSGWAACPSSALSWAPILYEFHRIFCSKILDTNSPSTYPSETSTEFEHATKPLSQMLPKLIRTENMSERTDSEK